MPNNKFTVLLQKKLRIIEFQLKAPILILEKFVLIIIRK